MPLLSLRMGRQQGQGAWPTTDADAAADAAATDAGQGAPVYYQTRRPAEPHVGSTICLDKTYLLDTGAGGAAAGLPPPLPGAAPPVWPPTTCDHAPPALRAGQPCIATRRPPRLSCPKTPFPAPVLQV